MLRERIGSPRSLAAALALVVGGCVSSSPSSPAPSGGTASFDVTVTGHAMAPSDHLTARKGQAITLTFTADADEEIHLHGFDRKWDLKAGQPMTQTFAADRSGSFEIEIEDTGTHLGELDVLPG